MKWETEVDKDLTFCMLCIYQLMTELVRAYERDATIADSHLIALAIATTNLSAL